MVNGKTKMVVKRLKFLNIIVVKNRIEMVKW